MSKKIVTNCFFLCILTLNAEEEATSNAEEEKETDDETSVGEGKWCNW